MLENKYEIEFVEETHTYLTNGIVTKSVTQLIHELFPNLYSKVPASILQASADFGSEVHLAIENHSKGLAVPSLTIQQEICFNQYLSLEESYSITPLENEKLVHYKDVYCGTLDMIATVNGSLALIDIKTTAQLNKEYLEWQLGLYWYALKSMGYESEIKEFYAVHLPKGKLGKLIKITPKSDEEIENFLQGVNK